MNKNILVTSAGQRVVLVEIFKKAIEDLGVEGKVFAADMNPKLAPAGYMAEKCFQVSRCTDSSYIENLLKLCQENSIGLIVPTIDTELRILSENKQCFVDAGVMPLVSSLDFIKICRDKRNTIAFFNKLGIDNPKAIDKYNPTFPMFAKPYDGSLSTNLHIIHHKDELTDDILNDEKLIFMEYIDANEFKEFTVDMYYGKDNNVKCIVPRERIKIRAGEINKGITRKNAIVNYLKQRMSHLSGVVGTICIQLFFRKKDMKIYGIEINPRFGGGYPLSYWAHADFPKNAIREYILGENLNYTDDWLGNTLMLRYDKEVIVYDAE